MQLGDKVAAILVVTAIVPLGFSPEGSPYVGGLFLVFSSLGLLAWNSPPDSGLAAWDFLGVIASAIGWPLLLSSFLPWSFAIALYIAPGLVYWTLLMMNERRGPRPRHTSPAFLAASLLSCTAGWPTMLISLGGGFGRPVN